MMSIVMKGYALPIEKAFVQILEKELQTIEQSEPVTKILNFRDPNYSSSEGGVHPVEIMINEQGLIQYITDFAYVGSGDMVELAKELDFDFSNGLLEQMGRCYPIEQAWELFKIWQQNFCAYYDMGIFEVEISQY